MCAFLATPQLFFQTGNCLLCTGRDITAARERLPALRFRPLGTALAEASGHRGSHSGPLCGR